MNDTGNVDGLDMGKSAKTKRAAGTVALVLAVLLTVTFFAVAALGAEDLVPLQLGPKRGFDVFWMRRHLVADTLFIFGYWALLTVLLNRLWSTTRSGTTARPLVLGAPTLLALLDLSENLCMVVLRARDDHGTVGTNDNWLAVLHVTAYLKWAMAIVVVVCIGWQVRRAPRATSTFVDPPSVIDDDPWTKLGSAAPARGIACSGGGIRSAAFSMGALHGLGKDAVRNSAYLAAVSGGAYTAAAMTKAAHEMAANDPQAVGAPSAPEVPELPFGRDSVEMRQLRSRSSFLFLNGADGRLTFVRVLAALLVNLVLLYGALYLTVRPIGWVTGVLHHELRAAGPFVDSFASSGRWAPEVKQLSEHDVDAGMDCPAGARGDYWVFTPAEGSFSYQRRLSVTDVGSDRRTITATGVAGGSGPTWSTATPGLVRSCGPRLELVRQPRLEVSSEVEIVRQPRYRINGDIIGTASASADAALVRRHVVLVEPPTVGPNHDVDPALSRPSIDIDAWIWAVTGVLLIVGVVTFAFPWTRGDRRGTPTLRDGRFLAVLPVLVVGWLVVAVVGPWFEQEVPRLLDDLPTVFGDAKVPVTSAISTIILWITGALASTGIAKFATGFLGAGGDSKPRRISMGLVKGMAFLVLAMTGVLVAVLIANQGAMIGPGGRGAGAWSGVEDVAHMLPDVLEWLLAFVVMIVVKELVETHSWSLNPIYRDRLARAFSLTSPEQFATPLPHDRNAVVESSTVDASRLEPVHVLARSAPDAAPVLWPELILCCAANINDGGSRLPAKRWADSFVFTPTHLGSPTLGYYDAARYFDRLTEERQRDLSMASIVAVSGAAFSPAMGNMNMGPIGGLFAVLNLRLGLWIPNPLSVFTEAERGHPPASAAPPASAPPEEPSWEGTPGWPYLLKEVFGRYRYDDPFVYTTDGGHWENLGLVELVRHGCREIVVLSAAGDSVDFFPTLGDAIALTREQTGVEIHLDASALRAVRSEEQSKTPRRQLLRWRGVSVEPQAMAAAPFVTGWWDDDQHGKGCVLFIEAALTDDLPWDVHTFAEQHNTFPDHPTSNQFYSHRTFEAYRRLGEHQASRAWNSDEWKALRRWAGCDQMQPNPVPEGPPSTSAARRRSREH